MNERFSATKDPIAKVVWVAPCGTRKVAALIFDEEDKGRKAKWLDRSCLRKSGRLERVSLPSGNRFEAAHD